MRAAGIDAGSRTALNAGSTVKRTILPSMRIRRAADDQGAVRARRHDVEVAGDPQHALDLRSARFRSRDHRRARDGSGKRGHCCGEFCDADAGAADRIIVATATCADDEETLARPACVRAQAFQPADLRLEAARLWEATALS